MDGQQFVTDTMIIDQRDQTTFIHAGQPFPREAMHPHTFAKLQSRGEVLPFTEGNRLLLNPRLARRRDVLGATGDERKEANSMRELVAIQDTETEQADRPAGPRNLVVPAPDTNDSGQQTPPEPPPTKQETKKPPAAIWTFDPKGLQQHEMPVLQQSMAERCAAFKIDVPTITDRDELIAFMSKDFVSSAQ